ncbi:hypothetical protein NDA11_005394 [Ustilago hordei]|uniref:Effector family protein Eff1 n=1 Tax=Ustilago hordei TaxID=120017 RepID=I2FUB8_USTHO|nr:uncharacterized protein UHO2_04940 [Ustilago hordei]KAJ1043215.1 hypothetical protein NDA10_005729 [Ustilago hordei]KAJ1573148.1 hypothetical protein NDA12_007272 [Ustilago hordei]KAJ1577578.1 hypothetical protein NDA11_005394 [Ustilago hordei]KAJ1582070.1 hypothetical protein NDA15_001458 [Ustilago hordei]KAJ1597888.1 hypothetical protein NDA14_006470 [Ustilago hordei]
MLGKTLKAFILLQLVVLATLAPILFAQRLGPQRVPSNGEQQRAHEGFLNQYPEETRATICANRGFTMQIPGHSAPAYISPAHIGYYHAIKVPSETLKECLLNHMMERGQPFFAEHPDGDVYFYSERTRGKGFEEEQVEETQAAGVREVLSREGSRTVILPKSNLAGEVAETSRNARSGLSSLRKIWKRSPLETKGKTSVGDILPPIDEDEVLLHKADQNSLLDTGALQREELLPAPRSVPIREGTKGSWFSGWKFPWYGDRSLSPSLSTKQVNQLLETSKLRPSAGSLKVWPATFRKQFLAVKLPGYGWDAATINRMRKTNMPFFVEGADGKVWYHNPKNQPTRFVRTKNRFDKEVRRAIREQKVDTVEMPSFAIRPAATEARSELSLTQRPTKGARELFGRVAGGFKYFRGP